MQVKRTSAKVYSIRSFETRTKGAVSNSLQLQQLREDLPHNATMLPTALLKWLKGNVNG